MKLKLAAAALVAATLSFVVPGATPQAEAAKVYIGIGLPGVYYGHGYGHRHRHCHRYRIWRHGHRAWVRRCHSHRHGHGHH